MNTVTGLQVIRNIWSTTQRRMSRGLVNWSLVLVRVDIQDSGVLGGEGRLVADVPRQWKHLGSGTFTHMIPYSPLGHEQGCSVIGVNQEIKVRASLYGLATKATCLHVFWELPQGSCRRWVGWAQEMVLAGKLPKSIAICNYDKYTVLRFTQPGFQAQLCVSSMCDFGSSSLRWEL